MTSFFLPLQSISLVQPRAAPLGGAGSGSLGGFSVQTQLQNQWCWAAVSTSVAVFFGSTQWTQCSVATTQFPGLACCGADASGGCNQPWYLDRALIQVGHFGSLTVPNAAYAVVMTEINGGRPLCCRIQWAGGGAHFVALGGWSQAPDGTDFVDVYDPYYGFVQTSYTDFCSSYRSPGDTWTHTYFTVSAVVAAAAGGAASDPSAPMSA
jgi:hypothetical protein